jgi:hypothetical protein
MWDSTASAATATPTATRHGVKVDARTGTPLTSTAEEPGVRAHTARLGVRLDRSKITLTPSKAMLTSSGTTWPVFIDPSWSWGAAQNGYAVISKQHSTTNYWKDSPSTSSDLQSGYDAETGDTRRTLLNFAIDTSRLNSTATIYTATMNITETWSYSCTATKADLYGPTSVLTSANATWSAWANVLGTQNDTATVAHGYSGCAAAGVAFDVATAVKADATGGRKTQTFVLKADDESAANGWKRWDKATPKITVEYDHTPNQPTAMKTSPTTACTGSTIGDAAVKFYATVSDPDGGTLTENFSVWKDGNTAVKKTIAIPNVTSGSSSSPATVDRTWFETYAKDTAGNTAATKFDWSLTTTQFALTSKASATCGFTFDPTRQGLADVTPPDSATIGVSASVQVVYDSPGTQPASYLYQINGGAFRTVTADSSGNATFSVTPTRTTNTVNVTAVSAGGNVSVDTRYVSFVAAPGTPEADGDLTGDANADLLAAGGAAGLPAGVWLAYGTGKQGLSLDPVATNLGASGNGTGHAGTTTYDPAGFTGAQVFTGHFTSSGLQDLIYYYPSDGTGGVLATNGDGSVIDPGADGSTSFTGNQLCELNFDTLATDCPTVLANAGDTEGNGSGFADLIGINGDSDSGYHLTYLANTGGPALYSPAADLSTTSPDGTMDWNNWTVATAQNSSGKTDMFLWNKTTGALSLWAGLALADDGNGDLTFTYTPTVLADGSSKTFEKSTDVSLRAADINHDGTTDLWTVGAGQAATAWLTTLSSATITAQGPQTLSTPNHSWKLDDGQDGTIGTALDTAGTLNASGAGHAAWNTGDLFDPDAAFDGTAGSVVATTGNAVTTNADFSVSVWAKPAAYEDIVVSQDGNTGCAFKVWPSSDGTWKFGMQRADVAYSGALWDIATSAAGTAELGIWYHLTMTFKASTGVMTLYVNDQLAATASHTSTWTAANKSFRIGDAQTTAPAHAAVFNGQIAMVQTWNSVVWPAPELQPGLWDRARTAAGTWSPNGSMIDSNGAISSSAITRGPDGTIHVFNMVPGSGIWYRSRSPQGVWQADATRIDTNTTITDVSASALPDGTVHVQALVPGSGIWDRTRSAAGVWASSSVHMDSSTLISAVSSAALPNGTLHVLTLLPGYGVYDRSLSTAGVWSGATRFDTNGNVSAVAAVGLPDGTLHSLTLLPSYGIYDHILSTAGTWDTAQRYDTNGSITEISAAAGPDGVLHLDDTITGHFIYHRTRSTAGVWDTNAAVIPTPAHPTDLVTWVPADNNPHIAYMPVLS